MTTTQLGPVVPITGSQAGVLKTAQAFADLAARIGAIDAQLLDLRASVLWESPAGWRFDTALRALPDVLDLLQARYRMASQALRQWSVDLRVGIHRSRAAVEAHEHARVELDEIERDLQAAALDPTGVAQERLRARRVAAIQRAIDAQEACSRAWLHLHEAASVCAADLRAAAQDSMVDSTAYALVRGARTTAAGLTAALGAAALVPSPVQAFAAAGAGVGTGLVVGADLLLLLGFDDGSWSDVLASSFWVVAGKGASGLTRAAGVGAAKTVNGTWTGQRLRTAERLRAGREQVVRDLRTQRAALRTPVVRAARSERPGTATPAAPWHRRTLDLIEDRLEAKVLGINDRWQMALANGGNAVVLQGGAEAIRVAQRARTLHQKSTWAGEQAAISHSESIPDRARQDAAVTR